MSEREIRLLIVDDEEDLVEYLSKRFTRHGVEVTGVTSGPEAVRAVKGSHFDVAVLDLKMPDMDGIEVLGEIKDEQPYIEVIMLTGHGSIEAALASGREDAFKFIAKPHDFDKLLEVVKEAAELKRTRQKEDYLDALNDVNSMSGTPQEIMARTEQLRKQFDQ